MNRIQLKIAIRKKLGETTAVFWSEDDLEQWIEDAQLDIVWEARCNRQRSLATSVASTVRYTLTALVANVLRINKVCIYNSTTSQWLKLIQKDQDFLDENYPGWESTDAGTPMYYVYDTDVNEFIIWPKANTAHVGTNYLEIYNATRPTAIATDADSSDLPDVLHKAVVEYVVAEGLESRGYQDIAEVHWNRYYGRIESYLTGKDFEEDGKVVMRPA